MNADELDEWLDGELCSGCGQRALRLFNGSCMPCVRNGEARAERARKRDAAIAASAQRYGLRIKKKTARAAR